MKLMFVSFGAMFILTSIAYGSKPDLSQSPSTQPAKFLYLENVPRNSHKISFELNKYCESTQSPIRVQEFYSQKEYQSADTRDTNSVRIVHVYAQTHSQTCKKVMNKRVEKTLEIPAVDSMTHVYITADPDITVRSLQ